MVMIVLDEIAEEMISVLLFFFQPLKKRRPSLLPSPHTLTWFDGVNIVSSPYINIV